MPVAQYELELASSSGRRLAAAWLVLGVCALAASGLYSILIVLSRTPVLHELIPWTDFFHTALVVHVDLSVLIWFLAMAGVIWTLSGSSAARALGWPALWLCVLGTLLITIAPFTGEGHPVMNNYIPVLRNPVFFTGLGLVGCGFSLLILRSMLSIRGVGFSSGPAALKLGAYAGVVAAGLALVSLAISWVQLNQLPAAALPEGRAYFEYLFWGGGHVLQFTHTVLLLLAWLWLAYAGGTPVKTAPGWTGLLLLCTVLPVLMSIPLSLQYEILSVQHRLGFTELMRWGGLGSVPLGLLLAFYVVRRVEIRPEQRPLRYALLASILLFAMGGVLAFMIEGVNVVIPAHYHGSIVGVTLAFMGLSYHLMPGLGFRPPSIRLASWQPWIYGGGQLLHILGLAWSGGYGVKRKTAGSAQGLENLPELAGMAMMGLGGLVAIIGGILFILIAIKSMWPR